ncbi:DUF1217 domain-containing protein [Pseudogemmobacter humi]|uniref:Flagellar protein n=1 Tax=Pseudogemmobacter humi TaxID=2483812 RepID=A0A3P5WP62_9RHOB|nr:DUF1217 domain-containing protein [Pseudogemmobacter humi]VDC20346.1 hypothetical protein XINFAN_00443 [Pseudogemmobacter humi]
MSFAPVIPAEGYTGWLLLKKTLPAQQQAHRASVVNQREAEYFRRNIGTVTSAGDLVADRSLLKVALTAFGLEEDLNAKAFIKKVLSDGVSSSDALANRLADKRYYAFARALGLDGTQVPATLEDGFANAMIDQYYARQFESAVGERNSSFRLALNAEREIAALAGSSASENAKWFTVMGNKPLRQVFESAFGLPSGFGRLDIDQQLKVLKSRAQSLFGSASFSQFTDSGKMEKLVRNYLVRDSLSTASVSPAQSALQLLARR